jgi:hypothetical protein
LNPLAKQRNSLFKFKSLNELKKDQTKIKIFKNSSFDSSFNSVQSLNTNLFHLLHLEYKSKGQQSWPTLPLASTSPLESVVLGQKGESKGEPTPFSNNEIEENAAANKSKLKLRGVGSYPRFSAILRAIRSIRLNRDEWKLIRYLNKILREKINNKGAACLGALSFGEPKAGGPQRGEDTNKKNLKKLIYKYKEAQKRDRYYSKIFTYNNIISKNILLRNMKFNFLKSTLSTILKKRIRLMSEILEDKPIKHYSLYSYLNFCIFSPPHLKGGNTKLSLNKYKGRKFGSFIKYNKIITYNFNSTAPFYPAISKNLSPFESAVKVPVISGAQPLGESLALPPLASASPLESLANDRRKRGIANTRGNIYIKDIYKLLFYLFKSMYCLISKPVLNYTNDKVTIQLFYYLNIPKKKVFRLFSISYINSIKKKWLAPARTPILPKGWKDGLYPARSTSPLELGGLRDKGPKEASQIFTGGWAFLATLLDSNPEGSNKPLHHPAYGSPKERVSHPSTSQPRLSEVGGRFARGVRGNTKIYIRWKLRKAISRLKFKIITKGGKNLLFNLRKFNLTKVYQNKFKLICAILSNKFNKPVELQLIRLHHPYHDSNILVNLLSLNIKNKRKKARVAIQKIYNKKPVKNLNDPNLKKTALPTAESLALPKAGTGKLIPAFLSGLNIKIAGRLMGEPIIPRITTKVFGKGATATGKVNFLDVARITKKNRKGAYTIKITSGQNFF